MLSDDMASGLVVLRGTCRPHGFFRQWVLAISTVVALAAAPAMAQCPAGAEHGLGATKGCEIRCAGEFTECTMTATHLDDCDDVTRLLEAWDEVNATAGVTRVPAVGSLPIINIQGNAICTDDGGVCDAATGANCVLPCLLGQAGSIQKGLPGLPGGGRVRFAQRTYMIQLDDPANLSDTVRFRWEDLCNSGADNCPVTELITPAGSNTVLPDCGDGNACTTDVCTLGVCSNTPDCVIDDDCNDNDACTVNFCTQDGCCDQLPVDCDDSNVCTDDSCNAATGCINVDNSARCDDGVVCTVDLCDPTTGCSNTPDDGNCDDNSVCTDDRCDLTLGCIFDDNSARCDDGVVCTVDTCDALTGCDNAPDDTNCNDNDVCTDDSCDLIDDCVFIDNSDRCDDGVTCTNDSCDPTTGCANVPDDGNCDDNSVCTDDSCDLTGDCMFDDNSARCDDGVACTVDTCDAITGCANVPDDGSCDDNDVCTDDICDPVAGCLNIDNSSRCDDGVACTVDSCNPTTGCVNVPDDGRCTDNDVCTDDSCDLTNDCVFVDNSDRCDDGVTCTNDSCDPTTGCANVADDGNCDDNSVCTDDRCDLINDCVFVDNSDRCDDGVTCTNDSCDPVTGCDNVPDDGNCTDNDVCTNDRCDLVDDCVFDDNSDRCDDGVDCTVDSCDPTTGCDNTPVDDSCDDNSVCTVDTCDAIKGCDNRTPPGLCEDNNACTTDSCDAVKGCSNIPDCRFAADCDDGNPCTVDVCTPDGCCENTPECTSSAGCSAPNACSIPICTGQGCCATQPIFCDDQDVCTVDSCDPIFGCTNERSACCGIDCPPTTKALFAVWNENERRFSGTERCIDSWDATLLSEYSGGTPNQLWRSFLQTNRGKARIDGVASSVVCGEDSIDAPLLGVASRVLSFDGQRVRSGKTLVGQGQEAGMVSYNPGGAGPTPASGGVLNVETRAPAVDGVPEVVAIDPVISGETRQTRDGNTSRGGVGTKGSALIYADVEVKWNAQGEVIQDTFLELTNDYPRDVRLQMYLVQGDTCIWADNAFTLTANQPVYWSARTGDPIGASPFSVLGEACPDDDPTNPGGTRIRGYVLIWAIDKFTGAEVRWNHLSGAATVVNYRDMTAWEYNAWAFQTVTDAEHGSTLLAPLGQLDFDGVEYESAPDMLSFDFFSAGTVLESGSNAISLDTELILWAMKKDLR
jgi:Dictyostelium (slime mold) repeat